MESNEYANTNVDVAPANERAELSRESTLESFVRRAKKPKEGNLDITSHWLMVIKKLPLGAPRNV